MEIENFVIEQESKDWMVLEFSHLGFIGKYSSNIEIRESKFKQKNYSAFIFKKINFF